ncbi:hypothetical protein [Arthrobacter sp. C9C5]|uniref:hypothetical protein n=1 Tax=Arthrobacter sp. C9C5 TaxID=2735267 RepID=UPI0015851CB2|nr:hypothetical protein [Arthrobacter sp. C9C5]NUU31415.1 hypothetical protein [Arthrobacter sp. C9C5]
MTGTRDPQQDGNIQAMLRDSGLEAATELRSTLEQLQALVPEQAPAPRTDLAALLSAGSARAVAGPADDLPFRPAEDLPDGVSSLADRRRGHKRRMALIGGAVIGAMSLGAGAVAASSHDFRENVGHTLGVIFQPAAPTRAPAPSVGTPSDLPAAPVPVPAGTSPSLTGPAAPSAQATAQVPKHAGPIATPPAVGRGGVLPTPGHRPVKPGSQGQNGRGLAPGPLPTSPTLPGLPTALPTAKP